MRELPLGDTERATEQLQVSALATRRQSVAPGRSDLPDL